jgi:hypothetical protein
MVPLDDAKRQMGDLDGDNIEDAADLFCLGADGGNAYVCFIATYLNRSGKFVNAGVLHAGSDFDWVVESHTIKDGQIMARTLVWRERDPHCCPTGKGEAVFLVRNGGLVRER